MNRDEISAQYKKIRPHKDLVHVGLLVGVALIIAIWALVSGNTNRSTTNTQKTEAQQFPLE